MYLKINWKMDINQHLPAPVDSPRGSANKPWYPPSPLQLEPTHVCQQGGSFTFMSMTMGCTKYPNAITPFPNILSCSHRSRGDLGIVKGHWDVIFRLHQINFG